MIRFPLIAAVAAVAAISAVAARPTDEPDASMARWRANMARHQHAVMYGVPAPYDAISDPTPDSQEKMRRGAAIFDRQCSSCHGWSGRGTGPEGFYLVPVPADLAWLAQTPKEKANPYIYWSIAEGGKAFESDMPAFKHSLTTEDIWSVTAYLRAGMPYASP